METLVSRYREEVGSLTLLYKNFLNLEYCHRKLHHHTKQLLQSYHHHHLSWLKISVVKFSFLSIFMSNLSNNNPIKALLFPNSFLQHLANFFMSSASTTLATNGLTNSYLNWAFWATRVCQLDGPLLPLLDYSWIPHDSWHYGWRRKSVAHFFLKKPLGTFTSNIKLGINHCFQCDIWT